MDYYIVSIIRQVLLEKAVSLLKTPGIKDEFLQRRKKMLEETIDVTAFLIWFVENYPESKAIMINDPSFQLSFQ